MGGLAFSDPRKVRQTPAAQANAPRIEAPSWFDQILDTLNAVELPLVGGVGDVVRALRPTPQDELLSVMAPLSVLGRRGLGKAGATQVYRGMAKAPANPVKVYHGSRSGMAPEIIPGRPFYTTSQKAMAQGYAEEARGHATAPLVTEYTIDPTDYMSRDDYQEVLNRHLPNNSWIDTYPSEAATVEYPGIAEELHAKGVKGVRDLWDFGMDGRQEHQVMVTLDPSTLRAKAKKKTGGGGGGEGGGGTPGTPLATLGPPRIPTPIKAYHGSPHDFEAFDASKIGTGEGAQAYGYGLYFAENENVAKQYRAQLSRDVLEYPDGRSFTPQRGPEYTASQALQDAKGDHEAAIESLKHLWPESEREAVIAKLREFKAAGVRPAANPGKTYEVNLHASPDELLDWDKPLSAQPPKVREIWEEAYRRRFGRKPELSRDISAAEAYNMLGSGSFPEASKALKGSPVKGIKYLDQGSRGAVRRDNLLQRYGNQEKAIAHIERQLAEAKQHDLPVSVRMLEEQLELVRRPPPTHNYVIFPGHEDLIEIAKKYGIPLATVQAAYAAYQRDQQQIPLSALGSKQ